MATARVVFTWPDTEQLICEVRVASSYPDAVNEAKAQALAMFREAIDVVNPVETVEGD